MDLMILSTLAMNRSMHAFNRNSIRILGILSTQICLWAKRRTSGMRKIKDHVAYGFMQNPSIFREILTKLSMYSLLYYHLWNVVGQYIIIIAFMKRNELTILYQCFGYKSQKTFSKSWQIFQTIDEQFVFICRIFRFLRLNFYNLNS